MTPTTEAGRAAEAPGCNCGYIASYDADHTLSCASRRGVERRTILAIEAEAAAKERERIRAMVESLPRHSYRYDPLSESVPCFDRRAVLTAIKGPA